MIIKTDTIKKIAFIVKGQQLLNQGFVDWFKFFFNKVRGYEFIEQPLHTDKLFPTIKDLAENKIRRVEINMPPRSCKTTMMVFLMAYVIAQKKPFNFIYTSYSGELLAKCANELKAILENDFFVQCYRNSISEIINENDMVDTFGNKKTSIVKNPKNNEKFTRKQFIFKDGSTIQFSPTGGAITGFGAGAVVEDDSYFSGAVIIDDPNNPVNAFSQIMNKRVKDWYDDVAMTRNNGKANKDGKLKGTIIVVQQRVCPDDLSGYIQEMYKKQYKSVICKLINNDGKCTLPDFYNQNDLEELQIKRIRFSTQYQQEAEIDKEQLMFNLDSFVFVDNKYIDNQAIKMALLTTDLSNDNQGVDNDFTCFCLWIITNDYKLILLDCFYKKLHHSVDKTELIASFYNRHSKLKPMILIENVGENSFRKSQLLKKYNINDVKIIERRGIPDISKPNSLFAGSKEIRLLNASEYVNVHKVFIKEEYKTIVLNEAKSITLQLVNKVHDDFCFVAGSKIKTINGDIEIQNIKAGDKVITPFGIREVECCKCTGEKEVIYNKELDLTGTPSHKILDNKKHYDNLIDAKLCNSIKYNLKNLLIWKIKWNILSMVYCIKGWEVPKKMEREVISFLITKPTKKELATNLFIVLSGNITIIKKLKKVILCITKMIIHLIIIPIIYNYLQGKNIYKDIIKQVHTKLKKLLKDKKNILLFLLKRRGSGIKVKKAEQKVVKYQNKQWQKQEKLEYVSYVAENMTIATFPKQMAELFAKNVMMLGGIENKEQLNLAKLPVWNLKVKGGCYFVNNILVSNCDNLADACVVMQLAS